ncbi:BON domain-containing protein [Paraburkholderia sp. Ac-20347]|jgi:hyperosmotically inducible periplasmic protein|uniref:BON domain-containing protein n=1 Tax=Paraburkholderia sp. Ac-20347 TaxID=2703892 RepID=UPI001980D5B9|nr:BON domain-containing protein [Paraburkholderia sp. Ac-20347]MBN3808944.1 BON domain-containing protein [Paraburkholderia sp. Ac-20347]
MTFTLLRNVCACLALGGAVAAYAQTDTPAADGSSMSAQAGAQAAPTNQKATKADRTLSRAVRRALSKAQGFDVSGVFVRARSGAVTLSGTVRNGDQIRQAEEVTRSVQGVTSVTNRLTLFHGGNG